MKTATITRPVDNLGRVVIPMEIRKSMKLPPGTALGITANPSSDIILLQPCRIQCVCCGERNEAALRERFGVVICLSCLDVMMSDIPKGALAP